MIAVAMSGGVDSCAATLILHEQGERVMGLTLVLDDGTPPPEHRQNASLICRRLGVPHLLVDARKAFDSVKDVFCREYLAGRTPNPCVACNRDIKFGFLLAHALSMGADRLATGHYARLGSHAGRMYVARGREEMSQEYFLGLVGQDALAKAVFPLAELTKPDAYRIVKDAGWDVPRYRGSRDVCFIPGGGYAGFVKRRTGLETVPGPIRDVRGRTVGVHRGALHYTVGQRKGLGIALGRRAYVLDVNARENTITIGDPGDWSRRELAVRRLNFMKADRIEGPMDAFLKVRYRQEASPAVVLPHGESGCLARYAGLYSPGQLAVFYDAEGAVLFAGIMEYPDGGEGRQEAPGD